MAEKRLISSSIWRDEWFGPLDSFHKCVWIGLFSACADDQGRLVDNAVLIRADVFPYEDVPAAEIDAALQRFAQDEKVCRYKVDGKAFIQILNWWEHQQHQWAMPSKWPAPDGWEDRIRATIKGVYTAVNWPTKGEKPPESKGEAEAPGDHPGDPPGHTTPEDQPGRQDLDLDLASDLATEPRPEESVRDAGACAPADATAPPPASPKRTLTAEQRQHKAMVRGLREWFTDCSSLKPPASGNPKRNGYLTLWWNPLQELAELVEWDMDRARAVIRASVNKLREGKCTIGSPMSIVKTARDLAAQNAVDGDRGRYMRGKYADRILH